MGGQRIGALARRIIINVEDAGGAAELQLARRALGDVEAWFAEQAERVFDNLKVALAAGGAEFRHVVKLNTYVRDLTSAKVVLLREIRTRRFEGHLPASTLVATPALVHEDMMLEVEAIAVVDDAGA